MTAPMTRMAEIRAADRQWTNVPGVENLVEVNRARHRRELLAEVDRLEAELAGAKELYQDIGVGFSITLKALAEKFALEQDAACRAFAVRALECLLNNNPSPTRTQINYLMAAIQRGEWPPKSEGP